MVSTYVSRPDSRGDDINNLLVSRFTRRINEYIVTQERKPSRMKIYDGTTDPDDHTHRFYWTMKILNFDERFWCIFFAATLTKYAMHWFTTLPAGTGSRPGPVPVQCGLRPRAAIIKGHHISLVDNSIYITFGPRFLAQ